jgi:hypothetical protein
MLSQGRRWLCRRNRLRAKSSLLSRIKLILVVQSALQKYSASQLTQITSISMHPASHRGAFRDRHGRRVRDAVDAAASGAMGSQGRRKPVSDRQAHRREMLLRTAKSCGPDAPALASSWRKHVGPTGLRCALSASDGDNKPITGESTKETVKTIACGSAGLFRWTCGDYARVLSTLHARLRVHWASGVPHALRGGNVHGKNSRTCGGIAKLCLDLTPLRGAKATKQSTLLASKLDCFAEPVIGRAFARPFGSQ